MEQLVNKYSGLPVVALNILEYINQNPMEINAINKNALQNLEKVRKLVLDIEQQRF